MASTTDSVPRRTALAALAAAAAPVFAQGARFPNRAVKMILPQPPGGAADRLGRVIGDRLEAYWKQPVVLENKPGGGVVIGTQALVRSPPDGHTIGLLGSSLSINAVQRKDLPYEVKDLQALSRVGYYSVALVASSSFPVNDIKDLVAMAKSRAGNRIPFGTNGIGTAAHVAGDMLNHMAGIDLQHVPYNGAAKMYTDIVGGVLPMGFSVVSSAEPFIKAGQMKVLGVTSSKRSPHYPQWPAIAETLPGFEVVNWAGFCGPAGLQPDTARQVSDGLLAVLNAQDMPAVLATMGIEHGPLGPAEFGAFIQSEMKRFAAVTRPLAPQK